MQMNSQEDINRKDYQVLHRQGTYFLLVFIIFITAFSIRLYHIDKPPLDFVPVRQYQQAHIARGYYYANLESVPEWKKQMALLNMERMGFQLEPRILEHLAVLGYRIIGHEALWIPRVLSSIFWIIGGIFLFLIARRITSSGAALFSTIYYLFLPFGISASRSFQPDPMMTMMLLCSIYLILRYNNKPSKSGLMTAAVASALAMLIKPYCLFLIFGAFFYLLVQRRGFMKSLFSSDFLIFTAISFCPTAVYYIHGILSNVGFLQEQAQVSFLPSLLIRPLFWGDWIKMIGHVVGYVPFIFSLIGLFMLRDRVTKALMAGLWSGYIIFGLFFTYHIHTHAYYQLQFIPVAALSLGPVGALALKKLTSGRNMIITIVIVAVILGIGLGLNQVPLGDYKNHMRTVGSLIGVNPEFRQFLTDDFAKEVKIAEEIGEIVKHSDNTILLTPYYGRTISYHGWLSGLPWPITFSLEGRKERGLDIPPEGELFNARYFTIRTHGKYIKYRPDFFIITAFNELETQVDLKNFLHSNFPVLAKTKYYLIYDLRKMAKNKG